MSFLHQLKRSVGKVVATVGVATYLFLAPAQVQAQEREREDCTLNCGAPASDSAVSTGKKVKKAESLYLTSLSPKSQAELGRRVQELEQKVRTAAGHEHSHTYAEYEVLINVLRDRVYELIEKYDPLRKDLNTVNNALDSLIRSTSTLTDTQRELVGQIDTIVGRLEVYDQSRKEVEERLNDPVMQYMRTIFAQGLQELDRAKAHETEQCTTVLQAYTQTATLENRIATERTTLAKEREIVAGHLVNLEKNQTLSTYDKVQRAEELRKGLDEKEATIADREENVQRLASAIPHLTGLCNEAKAEYDGLQIELPQRVQKNIFGKNNNTFQMEVGAQYDYADIGSSPVHRMSVQAAVCYQGNQVTVCAGAKVGKGSEATETADLATPATREQDGDYVTESSQTGSETRGLQYQWDASLRLASRDLYFGRSNWTLTPSAIASVVFSRERTTREVARTTQLYRGNQVVGDPVSASGSETEYSTDAAFVPTAALDLCRKLWGRESGKSLCARVGAGYDVQNEKAAFTAGGLVRF